MLTAHHIPGISNCVADMESRTIRDRTDWKLSPILSPIVFNMINEVFGPLEISVAPIIGSVIGITLYR